MSATLSRVPRTDDPEEVPAAQAVRAAAGAGVELQEVQTLPALGAVCDLVEGIWGPVRGTRPLTRELLRALVHTGNHVAGAYDGQRLVGACVGFLAAPGSVLHSYITGVDAQVRGRDVGFALKLHQRAWAMARGLTHITWTYDPLVRRNAHLNLVKLAARPSDYIVDFYGEMDDAISRGQGSDRLVVEWDLGAPAVVQACWGRPALLTRETEEHVHTVLRADGSGGPVVDAAPARARTLAVQVPDDIEHLRRLDPTTALVWRHAVREVLGGAMAHGGRVTGFSRSTGYVVEVGPP